MKRPWRDVRTVFGCMVLLCLLPAASAATREESVERLAATYHNLRQFNGTILVADEKGIICKKAYGMANFEWNVPNTTDTKFRIASVTKQFTAMLIMQLVAEGKIKLDAKLTTYLPDYRKDTGDRVTIAQLLGHTSGIRSYTSLPGFREKQARSAYTVSEFVKQFASGELEFEPGTKWSYSNSGYFLLGAIIEKVTGKPYAQVLQERIFRPLGMESSGYDVSATLLPKRASGYEPALDGDGYLNAPYIDMSVPYAAGALYSTVEDLYRWDRALYLDTLLPAPLKQRMFTAGLHQYAFGWGIEPIKLDDGKTVLPAMGHSGGINGFSSYIVRAPAKKEVVIILDNTSHAGRIQELASGILSILHDIPPRQPRKSVAEALSPLLAKGPVAEAIKAYRTLKAQKPTEYNFASPAELNGLGYRLVLQGRVPDAIEIFKLNVELFPRDGNAHDSLGEAYKTHGDKELAISSYRRALALDSNNANAAEMLKQLESSATPAAKAP